MGAFGEFKVVVSDEPAYVAGETYDIVLNSDHSFNEYDGTVNAAKEEEEVLPIPEAPELPTGTQSTEQPQTPEA